jgi:ATP-dependent DNA helicase PIF1
MTSNNYFIPKGFEELLNEVVPESKDDSEISLVNFSEDQKKAFNLLKEGKNILLTGEGGTGKSYIVKVFTEWVKENTTKTMFVTGTTGISAHNIGGITINSFTGIGTGANDIDSILKKIVKQKHLVNRLRTTDILVIDEISMMSADVFEKIHSVMSRIKRSTKLFGGIQLLLSGDFLQLMPVFKDRPKGASTACVLNEPVIDVNDHRLIFESDLFRKSFTRKNTICLEKNWRQMDDPVYSQLLSRLRFGKFTEEDIALLRTRMVSEKTISSDSPVILVSSNAKAHRINSKNLEILLKKCKEDEIFKYNASYLSNCVDDSNPLKQFLKNELKSQLSQRDLESLTLCKGAKVMLIKNINVESGLVNGATGTVSQFIDGSPIVNFGNGREVMIKESEWELELGEIKVIARQIPLMLSWSITTHKSQSLTFDSAIMDLSDCFTDAMVYVALSRVRTLSGLTLIGFDPEKIKVNKKTCDYLNSIYNGTECQL